MQTPVSPARRRATGLYPALGVMAIVSLALTGCVAAPAPTEESTAVSTEGSPAAPAPTEEPTAASKVVEPAGLIGAGVAEITEALESGEVTSEELVSAYLARIEAYDSPYGDQPGLAAITEINDKALGDAQKKDEARSQGNIEGPLHGVPVLVKELISVEGMKTPITTGADKEPIIATQDAFTVSKLREAGAIILAHTKAAEGPKNPYNQALHPGGSSSGNGAGIAAGYAPIALGEDTGGSIRHPSSWTSTVGLRATHGLVSLDGLRPATLWAHTLGPQANSVTDLATVMDVIAEFDPDHPASAEGPMTDTYSTHLDENYLRGKTIGVYQPARNASDRDVQNAFDEAVTVFEKAGATVVLMDMRLSSNPAQAKADGTEMLLEAPGQYSAGYSGPDYTLAADAYLSTLSADDSELASLAEPKNTLTSADLDVSTEKDIQTLDPEALATLEKSRQALRDWYAQAVDEYNVDFVVYPYSRNFPVDAALPPGGFKPNNGFLATFLGYPAVNVPAGFFEGGFPLGIDILGTEAFQDAEVLGAGFAFEQAADLTRAPASTPPLDGESDLLP